MLFSNEGFFDSTDERSNDNCPVCKTPLGSAFRKTERVYECEECDVVWMFHPYESSPTHIKRKSIEVITRPVNPSWEDVEQRMEGDPPCDDLPPRGWIG